MANGAGSHDVEAVWKTVDGLRVQLQKVSERAAVLDAKATDHHEDIVNLKTELVKVQVSLEAALAAAEERINQRFDRMRNWAIALVGVSVPIISALLGALAQGGFHG